eukprot:262764_1
MSLFSNFSMEEEYLIFEARVRLTDVYLPGEGMWIGKAWIKALSLYDHIIHGNTIYDEPLLTKRNQKQLLKILQFVMEDKWKDMTPYAYLNSLIDALMKKNGKIWVNIQQINELQVGLKEMFVTENNELGTYIQYLRHTCNAIKVYPIFKTCWQMTAQTFNLISRVSENNDNDDRRLVLRGQPVTCRLSNDKQIVFRPEFTKMQRFFGVKMILQHVYDDKSIKVHFNVDCLELDRYYASLHPRVMNVRGDSSFDITLPFIDRNLEQLTAIKLNMSIMIHNLE